MTLSFWVHVKLCYRILSYRYIVSYSIHISLRLRTVKRLTAWSPGANSSPEPISIRHLGNRLYWRQADWLQRSLPIVALHGQQSRPTDDVWLIHGCLCDEQRANWDISHSLQSNGFSLACHRYSARRHSLLVFDSSYASSHLPRS